MPPSVGRAVHAHLAELLEEHVHVLRPCALDEDLPARQPDRGDEGGRLDPVGDGARGPPGAARRLPRPRSARSRTPWMRAPISVQHRGEVGDLRLAGGVLDHRRALREHGRHQDVVGGGVARELEHDPSADEAVAVPVDVAVLGHESRRRAPRRRSGGSRSGGSRSRRLLASTPWPRRSGRAAGRARRSRPASSRRARRARPASRPRGSRSRGGRRGRGPRGRPRRPSREGRPT